MAKETTETDQDNHAWTTEEDLLLFRRIKRLLDTVPDHAYERVRSYVGHMLDERWRAQGRAARVDVAQRLIAGAKAAAALGMPNELERMPGDEDEIWRGAGSIR